MDGRGGEERVETHLRGKRRGSIYGWRDKGQEIGAKRGDSRGR